MKEYSILFYIEMKNILVVFFKEKEQCKNEKNIRNFTEIEENKRKRKGF